MKTRSKITLTVALIMVMIMAATMMALAAEKPSVTVSNETPEAGEEITFTIRTTNPSLEGNVSVSSNLTFVEVDGGIYSDATSFMMIAANRITYTYKVNDDAAGQEFSFNLSGLNAHSGNPEDEAEAIAGFSVSGTVAGGVEPETPSPEPSPAPSPEPSTPRPARPQQLDDAPKTGDVTTDYGTIALWVIAIGAIAALGTAGFIAHKKSSAK